MTRYSYYSCDLNDIWW